MIGTWSKSGTTWMQQLMGQLVFKGDPDIYGQLHSPWIEFRLQTKEDAFAMAEGQQHRRFLKTHSPFNCLPYQPSMKYLFVGRDARDVVWSMYNHQKIFTPLAYEAFNGPGLVGPALEPVKGDERDYYNFFLDNGYFQGLSPDVPFWHCIREWWKVKDLPNVMLLHYANLKADFEGEARKIAAFLEMDIEESLWPQIAEHCSIDYMREQARDIEMLHAIFEGGGERFLNKGTNGRWKDVLSQDEVDRCDAIALEELGEDCARWLRTGQMA